MFVSQFHALYNKEGLSAQVIEVFQKIIKSYFKRHGRNFPFRSNITPYNVVVSEMMLQQTQTGRVAEKFLQFTAQFPDFESLSKAPLENVLKSWQGLGYNRRAIALKKIAGIILNDHGGKLPSTVETLKKLPNIGHNTASSIIAFAFNKPVIFIETNIRRVYLYFFFPRKLTVQDKEIIPLIEATLDEKDSRKWYYALMDYGVMLKKKHPELNKQSAHYKKQIPFKGSNRQLRGKILKHLLSVSGESQRGLAARLNVDESKILQILTQLEKEGFITVSEKIVRIRKITD
ncbi:MAG: winged helix-turn-helix transcriptional regulator [Candidatus Lokiarchaeota archaeon]|nr:winged helix-turn-helix transcriptional regulator [Candidatus Lokiarchaeota archaeon]